VARYPSLTKCDELATWNLHAVNYFDSGHGKGWWDEAGVSIKHALCFEQVKPIGAKLHNAPNFVSFFQSHFNQDYASYSHVCKDVQRLFYEVKPTNVNQVDQFNAHTIVKTCTLHQVHNVEIDKISL
jgi:hypothetical protein